MIEEIIRELYRENLCTYYILPLLKLNKESFLSDFNFVDSFLDIDKRFIVVQVHDVYFFQHVIDKHPCYCGIYQHVETKVKYVCFVIPDTFKRDVQYFTNGQYSLMSAKAKSYIRMYSGLLYENRNANGIIVTDIRIQALDKGQALRRIWEQYLDLKEPMDSDQELLETPGISSYIDVGDLILLEV